MQVGRWWSIALLLCSDLFFHRTSSQLGFKLPHYSWELIDPRDVTGQMARCLFLSLPDTLITPSLKGFTQEELRQSAAVVVRRVAAETFLISAQGHHLVELGDAADHAGVVACLLRLPRCAL